MPRPRLGKVRLATWVRPEVRRALQAFCKRRREKLNVVLERAVEREVAAAREGGAPVIEWSDEVQCRR